MGCPTAYYPETKALVALESVGVGTDTPASKALAVRLERSARIV